MPLYPRLGYGGLAAQVHGLVLAVREERLDRPLQEGEPLQDEGDVELLGHFCLDLLVPLQLLRLPAAGSDCPQVRVGGHLQELEQVELPRVALLPVAEQPVGEADLEGELVVGAQQHHSSHYHSHQSSDVREELVHLVVRSVVDGRCARLVEEQRGQVVASDLKVDILKQLGDDYS